MALPTTITQSLNRALEKNASLTALNEAVKNGLPRSMNGNGKGIVEAITPDGQMKSLIEVVLDKDGGSLNPWFSYVIANGDAAGTANRNIIIGGLLGVAGRNVQFGQAATSASDAGAITSDGIANVGTLQGFAHLTLARPLIVQEIKLDGVEASIDGAWLYRTLHADQTIRDVRLSTAAIEKRTDFNVSTLSLRGSYLIDSLHSLVYVSSPADALTLHLLTSYWDGSRAFTYVGPSGE